MTTTTPVVETNLPLKRLSKGKVRDIYQVGDQLLLVATDRISAFDWVLPDPIPSKGACLTQLSKFWFDKMASIVPNQVIATEVENYPPALQSHRSELAYRSMLVKKTEVIPIECIVRGYLSGSAWSSYRNDGTVCDITLPHGLRESEKLDEPMFTPSTKAASGHDINISVEEMNRKVGATIGRKLESLSRAIYDAAVPYARSRGIIIADTKFEFGLYKGDVIWIDEALTPDSSRFWPADTYRPGTPQPSFDKQYVRDYLLTTGWDKNSTPPHLPADVVRGTTARYREAYEKITGQLFSFE